MLTELISAVQRDDEANGNGNGHTLTADELAEAEHQAVAHLPLRARTRAPSVELGERVVERAAPGRARGERDGRVFPLAKEWLARPRLGAECCGGNRVRRVGEDRRLLSRFLHVRSTLVVLQT